MERFTAFTIDLIFRLIANCMSNNWSNLDIQTQVNLFSALSVLPKTCKKEQLNTLYDFPIIDILYYVHNHELLREKFPHLISGWLEIFTNEQIGSLINALLDFV